MAQTTDIVLPADQTEGTTNVVGKWFKAVGDAVAANEPVLEITTDKVTVEIAAPADGVLVEILKAEGDNVAQGDVLGRVGAVVESDGSVEEAPPPPAAVSQADGTSRPPAETTSTTELSPAVRRMLKERGLEAGQIRGTGRGGRITVQDIESAVAASAAVKTEAKSKGRIVPHSPMRKSIAAHMVESMARAPHVTSVFEADLAAVVGHRDANRKAFEDRGIKLTFTSYFVVAGVAALKAVPEVNSRWHDDGLELFDECNIGIGTALEGGGLIVPVLKQAQELDFAVVAERLQDLTTRARAGQLSPKDVQEGTFTISNHGVSGSLVATPIIINQPQSAILGVGKLEHRPVVVDGRIEARPRCYVTLTIDHRVLDGFQANAFLTKWVETIERWDRPVS